MSYVMDPHAAAKQELKDLHNEIRNEIISAIKDNNGPLSLRALEQATGRHHILISKVVNQNENYFRRVPTRLRGKLGQLIGLHPHLERGEWG